MVSRIRERPVKFTDPDGRTPAEVIQFAGRTALAGLGASQLDSPAPGPGDLVGVILEGVALGACLVAGGWALGEVVVDAVSQNRESNNSQTPLYRAVNQAELDSIQSSGGRFSMGDGSTYEVGKLFTQDPQDAIGYALLANKSIAKDDPYVAVVSTSAPNGSYTPYYISDAKSAVIVPAENLQLLTPAVASPLQ